MNFGDILNEWDDVKKREPRSVEGNPVPPPKEKAPPNAREGMIAWMNRYGVPDKDDSRDEGDPRNEAARERERLERMRPEASVDLHGLSLDDALARLRLFLDDSVRSGYKKVLIIHGKGNHSEGDPVLVGGVSRFLEGYSAAGKRKAADKAWGGRGALVLYLKGNGRDGA